MIRKYHDHKPQTTPWHREEISKEGGGYVFCDAVLWLCFKLLFSIWSYQGHVHFLRGNKSKLFYLHATSKNEIHICSNKHETGLVYTENMFVTPVHLLTFQVETSILSIKVNVNKFLLL